MTTRLFAVQRGTIDPDGRPKLDGVLISDRGEAVHFGRSPTLQGLHDELGVTKANTELHARLKKRYPGGYRVMWLRNTRHPGLKAALRLLRARDPEALAPTKEDVATFVADAA